MPFEYSRAYDLYVVLGDPQGPPLWSWDEWSKAVSILNPWVSSSRGPAAVQSTQFVEDGRQDIKFGRIGWNDKGHQKWTHNSSVPNSESRSWRFLQTEVWAPSRQQCTRDNRPPDFWFAFRNEGYWKEPSLKFNPLAMLGIPLDDPRRPREGPGEIVRALANQLSAVWVAHKQRPWALSTGGSFFKDAIGDLITVGLFKPGPVHKNPLTPAAFAEDWERLG